MARRRTARRTRRGKGVKHSVKHYKKARRTRRGKKH